MRSLPPRRLAGGLLVYEATTPRARLLGLSGLAGLPPGIGLWLPRCRSVHTAGMRFALDLLWLDAGGRVVRVDRGVRPWRLRVCVRARSVVEMGAAPGFADSLPSGKDAARSASYVETCSRP